MSHLLLSLAALHMGGLHTYEKALVALIAFGPFVVLAVVVYVLRRRDDAREAADLEARRAAQPGDG
jgi:hypothetical protein